MLSFKTNKMDVFLFHSPVLCIDYCVTITRLQPAVLSGENFSMIAVENYFSVVTVVTVISFRFK